MTDILFCNECDAETDHTTTRTEIKERWQDSSIDDDDLDYFEVVSRANGDSTYEVTHVCNVCGHEENYEDM
jgi:hypothetical protein